MFRIALCDDEKEELARFTDRLRQYLHNRPEVDAELFAFQKGERLLEALGEGEVFDLYILDILMPDMNGIVLGQKIRAQDNLGEIIYLTISRDYAIDSFDVHAFHYLVKPVEEARLYSVLDDCILRSLRKQEEYTMVRTTEGAKRVMFDEVLYVERVGRRMRFILLHSQGTSSVSEVVLSRSLRISFRNALAEMAEDRRFFFCGASFLLNLAKIRAVNGRTVVFASGITLSVPRESAVALKHAWGAFWLDATGR